MFYSMMEFLCTIMSYSEIIEMAKHILKAQEIHEDSWDGQKYTLNEFDSVKKSILEGGKIRSDSYTRLISHIITFYWNDSMDWANQILEEHNKRNGIKEK